MNMDTNEPSRKRKRLSKNKKKNWRKTDVTDVEEHLEQERIQERTGGLAAEKSNAELFVIDKSTAAPNAIKKKFEKKSLKCHANLEPDPRIKPIKRKLNVRQNNPKKRTERVLAKEGPKAKEISSLTDRQRSLARNKAEKEKKQDKDAKIDLWGETDINSIPPTLDDHYATVTKKKRVKAPARLRQKRSEVPSVETALPGQSYNPTYEDHQDVLRSALEVEVTKAKEDARIKRALDDAFPDARNAPTQKTYIEEMSAGLFEEGDEDEVAVTEEDMAAINPPVRRENKKTDKQKKKAEELKLKAKEKLRQKEENLRKKDIFRLKTLNAEVKREEAELEEVVRQRHQKKEETDKTRTRKLGKLKYEEANIALKLSEEIEGSLRQLKPEGNLLEDRYKSIQKRNMVEPRQKHKVVKKYKQKKFEKAGHKAITL